MANYKNQNVITEISVEKIKHQSGVEESWMQPFSWDKMTIPLFLLNGNEYKVSMYIFQWAGQGYSDCPCAHNPPRPSSFSPGICPVRRSRAPPAARRRPGRASPAG